MKSSESSEATALRDSVLDVANLLRVAAIVMKRLAPAPETDEFLARCETRVRAIEARFAAAVEERIRDV